MEEEEKKKLDEEFTKKGLTPEYLNNLKGTIDTSFPKEKEETIFANISALNYEELKKKYIGVDIDGIIEKKVKYYRLKPFKKRSYAWWCDQIKEFIFKIFQIFDCI
jgi:hypothetical protein